MSSTSLQTTFTLEGYKNTLTHTHTHTHTQHTHTHQHVCDNDKDVTFISACKGNI